VISIVYLYTGERMVQGATWYVVCFMNPNIVPCTDRIEEGYVQNTLLN
jgi:hypothetical protein